MSEGKMLKGFVNFLEGVGKTVKTEMDLDVLKVKYPNEWAIFAEGELDEKVKGLCIYCGEPTRVSNVCVGCEDLMS